MDMKILAAPAQCFLQISCLPFSFKRRSLNLYCKKSTKSVNERKWLRTSQCTLYNKVCESRVLDSLKYLDVWVCLTAPGLCLKRPITYVHIYMVWYSRFQAYLVVWLTRLHGERAKRMREVNNWQRKGTYIHIDNAESITARTRSNTPRQPALFSSLFGFGSFMSAQQKPLNSQLPSIWSTQGERG